MSNSANNFSGFLSTQKELRNLTKLAETASTGRILNLTQVDTTAEDYNEKPFFRDWRLNRSIIIKHTLRKEELDLFNKPVKTATKVIIPFDPKDLKLGGGAFFVGQKNYVGFLREYFETLETAMLPDVQILNALNETPSLDPFLIKESLSRIGFKPATCYLKLSPHDIAQMQSFANHEIGKIVSLAFKDDNSISSSKLARSLLSNENDALLMPLQATLKLGMHEFLDGLFAWRGFLYFKWRHEQLQREIKTVFGQLASFMPLGKPDKDVTEYLLTARTQLARKMVATLTTAGRLLRIYDEAYHFMINQSDPKPFRNFLQKGPSLFMQLGEDVGLLNHICSYWTYRMRENTLSYKMGIEEYLDMLDNFNASLAVIDIDSFASDDSLRTLMR